MNQKSNTHTAHDDRNDSNHDFALAIKHALNEQAQALPVATLDKLYAARRQALLVRKIQNPQGSWQSILSNTRTILRNTLGSFGKPIAIVMPILVMAIGLYSLSTGNVENYVQTVAEIDAQVLTQELPINALLDKGFVQYVQVGE